jgi:nicotinamidase-related amidase
MSEKTRLWDASERALVLIDYQDTVLNIVFEQDRRVIELNARTLAKAALDFKIPVVLSREENLPAVLRGSRRPEESS